MEESNYKRIQYAGALFAISAALFLVGFLTLPEGYSESQAMILIVTDVFAWRIGHILMGFGMLVAATATLMLFAGRSRWSRGALGIVQCSLIVVFAVLSFLGLIIEGSVIPDVALANDANAFHHWFGIAQGFFVPSFSLFLVGVALLAAFEFRSHLPVMPKWSCLLAATVAALISVRIPVGVVVRDPSLQIVYGASLVPTVWLFAFGQRLMLKKTSVNRSLTRRYVLPENGERPQIKGFYWQIIMQLPSRCSPRE